MQAVEVVACLQNNAALDSARSGLVPELGRETADRGRDRRVGPHRGGLRGGVCAQHARPPIDRSRFFPQRLPVIASGGNTYPPIDGVGGAITRQPSSSVAGMVVVAATDGVPPRWTTAKYAFRS
jgi:hypothetical protein